MYILKVSYKDTEGGDEKLNKLFLKSHMARYGDTQKNLADAIGLSLSRLNAKINSAKGAEFTQNEISFIAQRYKLKARDIEDVFFNYQ